MSRRTRRHWGEAKSSRMLAVTLEFHFQVIDLMTRAPVASPVYRELLSLSDATLKACLFLGHDPSAKSIGQIVGRNN